MSDGSGPRLERNPDFRLESGSGGYAFVHASGFRVETDLLGKFVWECLPDRPSGIAARAGGELGGVPQAALAAFVEVMRRAGLAGAEGTPWPDILPAPGEAGEEGAAGLPRPRVPSSRSSSRPSTAWSISTPASARSAGRSIPTSKSSPWTMPRPTGRSSASAPLIPGSRSSPSAGTCTIRAA